MPRGVHADCGKTWRFAAWGAGAVLAASLVLQGWRLAGLESVRVADDGISIRVAIADENQDPAIPEGWEPTGLWRVGRTAQDFQLFGPPTIRRDADDRLHRDGERGGVAAPTLREPGLQAIRVLPFRARLVGVIGQEQQLSAVIEETGTRRHRVVGAGRRIPELDLTVQRIERAGSGTSRSRAVVLVRDERSGEDVELQEGAPPPAGTVQAVLTFPGSPDPVEVELNQSIERSGLRYEVREIVADAGLVVLERRRPGGLSETIRLGRPMPETSSDEDE